MNPLASQVRGAGAVGNMVNLTDYVVKVAKDISVAKRIIIIRTCRV
jgi:hypothetical protein